MVVRNGSVPVSPQRRLVAWRQFTTSEAGHSRARAGRLSRRAPQVRWRINEVSLVAKTRRRVGEERLNSGADHSDPEATW